MSSNKVSLITGGASGMGLAVATALSEQGGWDIHILDLHKERGQQTASTLNNTTFHQSDVTSESGLASIFKTVYNTSNRLDFVFANAGIAEHANFFETGPVDSEPKLPVAGMHAIVDINLKSVITTSRLALHYMRQSPSSTSTSVLDKSLIITASCGSFYPSPYAPIYTATKHAVVGFMRAIAPYYYKEAGIRVNAICPGTVKTNLLTTEEWSNFPDEYFTPVEKIAETVVMLVGGKDVGGKIVSGGGGEVIEGTEKKEGGGGFGGVLVGKAVEISGRNHYYREQAEYCDEGMRKVMGATEITELKVKKV